MGKVNRYRVWCLNEKNYAFEWNTSEPQFCPNDRVNHQINTDLTIITDETENELDVVDSVTLNIGEVYTTVIYDTGKFSNYQLKVVSDSGGLIELQISENKTIWSNLLVETIVSGVYNNSGIIQSKYARVRYTNGNTGSSNFNVLLTFSKNNSMQAELPSGELGNLQISNTRNLHVEIMEPVTAYGDLRTSQLSPKVQLMFQYGIIDEMCYINSSGAATFSDNDSKIGLIVNVDGDICELNSKKSARYYPGQGLLSRFSCQFALKEAGMKQYCGMGNDSDGFYIGSDGINFGIVRISDGVEYWDFQDTWNIDKLDETSLCSFVFDHTKGNIFQISFQWCGYGAITFFIEDPSTGKFIPFHKISNLNGTNTFTVNSSIFSSRFYIKNTTKITSSTLFIGSSAIFTEGKVKRLGPVRNISNTENGVGTTTRHLLTIRNRLIFKGKINRTRCFIFKINIINDHIKHGEIKIIKNLPMVVNAWKFVNQLNSVIEYTTDTNYNTYTLGNGDLRFLDSEDDESGLLSPILGEFIGKEESKDIDGVCREIILNPGESLSILGRESQSKNGVMSASFTWQEDF